MDGKLTDTKDEEVVIDLELSGNTEVEENLAQQSSALEVRAKGMVINSDDDFQSAADFAKQIKSQSVAIKEFFEPMKNAAYTAHKQICDREKAMLQPLTVAEKVIKTNMGAYQQKKEEERRKAEAEMRRLMQEEANRKLAESLKAESAGDKGTADAALAAADMLDKQSNLISLTPDTAKVSGVSTTSSWEIESIDDSKVPVELNGVVLRPVSESAVKALIRSTKGNVNIPGVKFKEVKNISIRR
jgi:hypothetical protein